MVRRLIVLGLALLLAPTAVLAQQPASPIPLYPDAAPPSIEPEPLPPTPPNWHPDTPAPPPAGSGTLAPPSSGAPAPPGAVAEAAEPAGARVFCHQAVTPHIADADSVPSPYRRFIGIWSDAAWTPQLCAALIVEGVGPGGDARIVYAFGSMNADPIGPGGVLHGTGVIRNGELRFQNSDGSQFAFRPFYGDLEGRLMTPQGQSYQAIFKHTP